MNGYQIHLSNRFLVQHLMHGDNIPGTNVQIPREIDVNVVVDVEIREITNTSDLKSNEHMIQILDPTDKKVADLYGRANKIGGKEVYLNADDVPNMIKGNDNNTIPHELGHTAGLLHPDQQSWIWGEQYMNYNSTTENNFMWSNTGNYQVNDKTATDITPKQVEIMQENYENGQLNKK